MKPSTAVQCIVRLTIFAIFIQVNCIQYRKQIGNGINTKDREHKITNIGAC